MTRRLYVLTLLIAALLSSCKKSDFEYENSFEKSHRAWLDYKKASDNSYSYTVTGGSWTGISWETNLLVFKGEVISRRFRYTRVDDLIKKNIPAEQLEWAEMEGELNSHQTTPAAEVITVDEVYKRAKNVWLKKREGVKVIFEANNNGLISSCGYIPDGCQDDCFSGITISKIEPVAIQFGPH